MYLQTLDNEKDEQTVVITDCSGTEDNNKYENHHISMQCFVSISSHWFSVLIRERKKKAFD